MNAIMTDFDFKRGSEPFPQKWEGLAELDQALAEDGLTAYRWQKTWADPWARRATFAVLGLFCLYAVFVVYADVLSK